MLLPYLLTKLREKRLAASFVLVDEARDSTRSGRGRIRPAPRRYFDWTAFESVVSTPALDLTTFANSDFISSPSLGRCLGCSWGKVHRVHAGVWTRKAEAQVERER